MTKTRTDSESALMIAEAGVNDEIARIQSRYKTEDPTNWSTDPTVISGEPYPGRKGSLSNINGNYWVYASTTPGGTIPWDGAGSGWINATARVNKSVRKVSIEINGAAGGPGTYAPLAGDFNCIFFTSGNSQGGHSEGPVACGGNFQGSYEINQHGHKASVDGVGNIGLYVSGNATSNGNTKKLFGGTNAHVLGNVTNQMQMNGGGVILNTVRPSWFTEQYNTAKAYSQAIRALPKVKLVVPKNNLNLNVSTNNLNGNLKVYEVSVQDLRSLMTVTISGQTANDTVIFDVVGTSADWAWQINSSYKSKLIWNFLDVNALKVKDRNFTGMMLAPDANLVQQQNIQGNVYVSNWTATGAPEIHYTSGFKFNGSLPTLPNSGSPKFEVLGNYRELQ